MPEKTKTREHLLSAVSEAAALLIKPDGYDRKHKYNSAAELLCGVFNIAGVHIWASADGKGAGLFREQLLWDQCEKKDKSTGAEYSTTVKESEYKQFISRGVYNGSVSCFGLFGASEAESGQLLAVPVVLEGFLWGVICWSREGTAFSDYEAELLVRAGEIIASAYAQDREREELIHTAEKALEASKEKSDFLSRMSHEIRTPMNAIIGMSDIARTTNDLEKLKSCNEKISTASYQLLALINDILDLSKIEAGSFSLSNEEFDLEHMIENIVTINESRISDKRIDFDVIIDGSISRKIYSDELRLTQVLMNILSNAAKFTPERGEIALRCGIRETGAGKAALSFSVKDNGIGMSEEQMVDLFSSYKQADKNIAKKYGGTGLGLAICNRIVTLMGGKIKVKSEPGVGSEFSFEINVNLASPLDQDRKKDALQSELSVLVVDDSADVRMYFEGVLESFSVKCDTACGGAEAIEKAKKALDGGTPYDIIFVDWMMPGLDGVETGRQIKQLMDDEVIVIMISVADWSDIEKDALAADIKNYLPKPVLPSALYNKIVELTSKTLIKESGEPEKMVFDWSGKRILLADDIEINREIIHSLIEETGVQIDDALNGIEAVEMFRSGVGYDLILMDVHMPVLDGIEATKRIRVSSVKRASDVPIIAMTANAFTEDINDCIEAGMNEHIAKPIDIKDFFRKLSIYLNI